MAKSATETGNSTNAGGVTPPKSAEPSISPDTDSSNTEDKKRPSKH